MWNNAQNIEETRRRIRYRLLNWTVHAELAKKYFEEVARKRREDGYFEALYVTQDSNERYLQFFAGQHPVGMPQTTWDKCGRLVRRLHVEHGAALLMSQSIRGEVAVFLFPYKSAKHGRRENFIVWQVFDDPAEITKMALRRMTRDFFTYIRVSSTHFTPSPVDRLRISWLLLLSHRYDEAGLLRFILSGPVVLAVSLLGSLASILGLAYALRK